MPSMAAAIITPARLDRDSRISSVWAALPAASDISSASSCSPASRHATAGLRRNFARNAGSASRRSISWAAMSASVADTGESLLRPAAHAIQQRLADDEHDRQEERDPQRAEHDIDRHRRARDLLHDRHVAQREDDRERAGERGPDEPPDRVAAEHRRVVRAALPGQLARELRAGAPAQARLAQHVDEDVVAVALDERVEVEERADVAGERE